jgi:hypothetical protein
MIVKSIESNKLKIVDQKLPLEKIVIKNDKADNQSSINATNITRFLNFIIQYQVTNANKEKTRLINTNKR